MKNYFYEAMEPNEFIVTGVYTEDATHEYRVLVDLNALAPSDNPTIVQLNELLSAAGAHYKKDLVYVALISNEVECAEEIKSPYEAYLAVENNKALEYLYNLHAAPQLWDEDDNSLPF